MLMHSRQIFDLLTVGPVAEMVECNKVRLLMLPLILGVDKGVIKL